MGKDLNTHFLATGLANVVANASFNVYTSPEDVEFFYNLIRNWFLAPEITAAAIKYGAATEELCDDLRRAQELWKRHPGAMVGIAYGEAVAAKPFESQ